MKVYNNNQLHKSSAGDRQWNSGRQNWIFGRIDDREDAISDPVYTYIWYKWIHTKGLQKLLSLKYLNLLLMTAKNCTKKRADGTCGVVVLLI